MSDKDISNAKEQRTTLNVVKLIIRGCYLQQMVAEWKINTAQIGDA